MIHAYNSMTDNSLCSPYSTPTRSISSAQIVPYRSSLTAPSSLPSHQLPALTGLTNTPLEPASLWGRTDTRLDEGLMEPDVKGETQWHFSFHFTAKFTIQHQRQQRRIKREVRCMHTPETHLPPYTILWCCPAYNPDSCCCSNMCNLMSFFYHFTMEAAI